MQHKFHRHELTGNVPFGFDCLYTFADGTTLTSPKALSAAALVLHGHGEPISKQLIDNPVEQDAIRNMARWRASGWKLERIADQLNARGIRTKLGGLWQFGHVASVLGNRHTARVLQVQVPAQQAA